MNYDLDTDDGMKNAMEWTRRTLSHIKQGGTWAIPRSNTFIKVDHENKTAYLINATNEQNIIRILNELGWHTVILQEE